MRMGSLLMTTHIYLDSIVQSIKCKHPNDGEVLQGHLILKLLDKIYMHQFTEWMKAIHIFGEQMLLKYTQLTTKIQFSTRMATTKSYNGDWLYMVP